MPLTKKDRIVVTSALPYANGSIHIGHLVEYIQTDIFVRFLKSIGKDVVYCCADDAHGTAIEIKANELGITPEELIAKVQKEHIEDFSKFCIEFDSYHSTHSEENKQLVIDIFTKLQEKGLIYTKDVENFYDEKEKRFLPDRYVKGKCPKCDAPDQYGDVCENCGSTYKPIDLVEPYSTLSKTTPVLKTSKHYFFKLSLMSEKLKAYFQERSFQPEIVAYLNNWIDEGLADWDISRDGPYFGFTIPGEEEKYFYVWLDAPVGYFASLKNYCTQHGKDFDSYLFSDESELVHFIGKDIIYFHYLFWPAMLMEARYPVPDNMHVHGFLTVNGEKMSKSRGTFFTAKEFATKYEPEYLRYYYANVLSRKMQDIDLDFKGFEDAINNELVANLGNFCFRVLSFSSKHFDGNLAAVPFPENIKKECEGKVANILQYYHDVEFNKAVKEIMSLAAIGNKYFQDAEPWKKIKDNKDDCASVLHHCVTLIRTLGIVIAPVLPAFSAKLFSQLGEKNLVWNDISFEVGDVTLGTPVILIQKIEEEKKTVESKVNTTESPREDDSNVFPLNLKVAQILSVEEHPDAEKLLVLQIDLGKEKRQLCAGIRGHYTPEELVAKKVVVVSNLKTAKLRGVQSQGMLLAASEGDKVVLIETDAPLGSEILFGDQENRTGRIELKTFLTIDLCIREKTLFANGVKGSVDGGKLFCDVPDGSKVK